MTLDSGIVRQRCEEIDLSLARLRQFRMVPPKALYWTVEYDRVYDLLQQDIEDLAEFSRAVSELL